jgi:hypothetical protein
MTNSAACPPQNETKPRQVGSRSGPGPASATRFCSHCAPVSLRGPLRSPGARCRVACPTEMTRDKGTNKLVPPERTSCASRKIRAPITRFLSINTIRARRGDSTFISVLCFIAPLSFAFFSLFFAPTFVPRVGPRAAQEQQALDHFAPDPKQVSNPARA